jgi:hypothetical protein
MQYHRAFFTLWPSVISVVRHGFLNFRRLTSLNLRIDLQRHLLRPGRIRKMNLILILGLPTRALPYQKHKLALYRLNRHPIVVKFLVENENMNAC